MLKHLVITLILMGFALPALADDIGEANELLVEAVQLLQSAEGTANAAERFGALKDYKAGKLKANPNGIEYLSL